jgi:hypothetical protein
MLVVVALTAIAVFSIQHVLRLNAARDDFKNAQALWEVGRIRLASFLNAERRLHEVEIRIPWISQRQAIEWHITRVAQIIKNEENRFAIGLWGGSDEAYDAKVEELVRLNRELAALRGQLRP